eukprot:TRINITY_DN1006_c0_g1_i2.p1 TRINITY_DN1006_c0_g1~~TRINITY_DN1006_c0_g1_i2.p1  ORF type:complete len:434 (+),score=104.46 TRINITY_DN1006_c0_g1_i2:45-1304(+)
MRSTTTPTLFVLVLVTLVAAAVAQGKHGVILKPIPPSTVTFPTPLQDWVWKEQTDSKFGWEVYGKHRNEGTMSTTYYINMTMFHWLPKGVNTQYYWWSNVAVTVPDTVKYPGHAAIYADGGSNRGGMSGNDPIGNDFVGYLQAPVAHLFDVPNQPIAFYAEQNGTVGRHEDGLIAYTWRHFLQDPSDPEWLLRLPMVKEVVCTMDMLEEFLPTIKSPVSHSYYVAGASKRGWTTWLTPAVDQRVKAIIPMVMPILNMVDVIHQMWRSLGEWSFALDPYNKLNCMDYLNTPQFKQMANIIDPLYYMPYLATIPKYLVFSTGDEFFLPDSTRNFFDRLQQQGGETHLRMMPNTEHSLAPHDLRALENIATFVVSVMEDEVRPSITEQIIYSNTTGLHLVYFFSRCPHFVFYLLSSLLSTHP